MKAENELRVLGFKPYDERLNVTRYTETHFPITRFNSLDDVEKRREELRFNLRMAAGLYPYPEKTPLNTKRDLVGVYDGYRVEKIMFESRPGLWSLGNLYIPEPCPKKAPAIFNVIGHWEKQRLARVETADYPAQLANFAKMGFIALVTDMIGKVDSRQLSHEYGKGRDKELWLSNGLGVQLWNNIRAIDLLCSMPEVDADNIGLTGASGGGSQTLFLALLDERIKAAAPINMISLNMQGGCQCENAAGLRRETDNTEMCAMLAPRALFLAGSDGDWTQYLETDELPAVLEAYRQYGKEEMLEHFYQSAPHQYNGKTRHKVYNFFARHLMNKDIEWQEQEIKVDDLLGLTWFKGQGRAEGFSSDEEYFSAHKEDILSRVSSLPDDEKRKMLAWVVGKRANNPRTVKLTSYEEENYTVEKWLVLGDYGERLPLVKLVPNEPTGSSLLILSDSGKDCLLSPENKDLLLRGVTLVSADILSTGETAGLLPTFFRSDEYAVKLDEKYRTTFNYTLDAYRVQDVSLLISALSRDGEVKLVADGIAAPCALLALALTDGVSEAELSFKTQLSGDEDYAERFFIPGICALGGISLAKELALCKIIYR